MGLLIQGEEELNSKIALNNNGFTSQVPLIENVRKLWLSEFACDVFFAVGKERKRFVAHRLVLAAGSEYFRDLFLTGEGGAGSRESPLEIQDVTAEAMDAVLQFLYSDQRPYCISLDSKSVVHVLYAAQKYKIPQLRSACLLQIRNLDPSNCIHILQQAILYKENLLIQKCFAVIDGNSDEILVSEAFLDCDRDTIGILVNRDTFSPSNEFRLFMALLSWSIVECQRCHLDITPSNQRKVLGGLMILVNLHALSNEEIEDAIRTGLLTREEVSQFLQETDAEADTSNPFGSPDEVFESKPIERKEEERRSFTSVPLSDALSTSSIFSQHFKASQRRTELYYTISRFHHTLKSTKSTKNIKLTWQVNRNIELIGFSIFGFCSGGNNDVRSNKPTVTIRKNYGIQMTLPEKLAVEIIPFKYMIRVMFKQKRKIKADKKHTIELKLDSATKRERFEGFGEINPQVKLPNGDTVTFTFDNDPNVAELYFVPDEETERVSMIPLQTDFLRNISEKNVSKLKLRGSRWSSQS